MKKLAIVAITAILTVGCQTEKTGYVDTEKLLVEYTELIEVKELFTNQNEDITKEIQLKIDAFEIKGKQFQANSPSMSRTKQEEKYNELALEQQQIQNEQRTRVGKLQVESQTAIDSLIKKVKKSVRTYGENNGYTYIYGANDAGSVLYGKDEMNLTETILKDLNDSYKVSKE